MIDQLSINSALTGIKTAMDIGRLVKDSGPALKDAELKYKMADLLNALSDVKIALSDAKEELQEKDKEIKRLKDALNPTVQLKLAHGAYFEVDESGRITGTPYCSYCHDSEGKNTRLAKSPVFDYIGQCPGCKQHYSFEGTRVIL
jgi:hypothetical protein